MTMVHIEHEIGRYMILCEGHSADEKCCNYITGVMYAFGGYVKNMEAEGDCEVYGFEIDEGAPRFLIHCGGDERIEDACIGQLVFYQCLFIRLQSWGKFNSFVKWQKRNACLI